MTRMKHSVDGKNLAIYGETANINYFLVNDLTPDSVDGVVNKETRRKDASVRRYVGDPTPYNRPGGDVKFMYDPGRIDLQTLPGKPFILADGTEKRQFSYSGDVMELHSFLVGNVKKETKLYTSGPPYVIAGPEAQEQAARTR